MTSRLKRKLDNMGIDPSSSSSKLTESFCLIGTPLPPLDKAKDLGEFQPVWNQEVRDEKGRRRFHGAFTGGFSAGYFNTAGSEEGWTPSTFVSSRNARVAKKPARAEDFMDEEDLSAFQDSQKLVDTTESSDLLGGTEAEMRRRGAADVEDDSVASAIKNLIPAVEESVGAKLLQKMGWRPGQGVGPRVTYARLKQQDARSSSSSVRKPMPEVDEEASKHTFAPRDTEIPTYHVKDNNFGLGYSRGPGLQAVAAGPGTKPASGPNISAGFGLGAVNDADEDDLDVYDGGEDRRSGRRIAFEDEDDNETISLGQSNTRAPAAAKPTTSKGQGNVFHDGKPVPSGFIVAAKPEVEDTWFELPPVPKGWKPDPTKIWASSAIEGQRGVRDQENVPPHSQPPTLARDSRTGKVKISADERGAALGEKRLPAAPRSVFDYLSAKDRERLQAFSKSREAPSSSGGIPTPPLDGTTTTAAPPPPTPSEPISLPSLHPSIAKAAMAGFQPFTSDPDKQDRYDTFLRYHATATPSSTPNLTRRPGQSNEEFTKELSDFTKAAMIFKPATGAMANRFTSAVIVDTGPKAIEGLHMPSTQGYLSTPAVEEEKEESKEEEDPKKYAAKMGMWGKLTRETVKWQPARLLCKRFGVKDPSSVPGAPESAFSDEAAAPGVPITFTGASAKAQPGGDVKASSATAPLAITSGVEGQMPPPAAVPAAPGRKDPANIGLGEDESQGRDTLTYERPPMDIFKAIFASDDEDSSDDEDEVLVPGAKEAPNSKVAWARQENSGGAASIVEPSVKLQTPSQPGPSKAKTSAGTIPDDDEDSMPVDPSKFKPTFVSRAEREGKKDKDGQDKKEKKKKAIKPLVSFDDDNTEELSSLSIKPKKTGSQKDKEKEKKKRRREKEENGDDPSQKKVKVKEVGGDDDAMQWVEKEPTGVPAAAKGVGASGPARSGRKTAADFM